MSILDIIAAIQAINEGFMGANHAPVSWPGSLASANLPLAIVYPRDAQLSSAAEGLDRIDRTFAIEFYVKPPRQGQVMDEGVRETIALLDSATSAWLDACRDNILLDATSQVYLQSSFESPFTDGGVQILNYAGQEYWGFVLTIRLTEKRRV